MEELSVGPDQDEIDALIDEQAKIAESPSMKFKHSYYC